LGTDRVNIHQDDDVSILLLSIIANRKGKVRKRDRFRSERCCSILPFAIRFASRALVIMPSAASESSFPSQERNPEPSHPSEEEQPPQHTAIVHRCHSEPSGYLSSNAERRQQEQRQGSHHRTDSIVTTEQLHSVAVSTHTNCADHFDDTRNNNSNNNNINNSNTTSKQQLFYGIYGHLRQMLDYTYHSFYKKERQWLHDAIIDDALVSLLPPSKEEPETNGATSSTDRMNATATTTSDSESTVNQYSLTTLATKIAPTTSTASTTATAAKMMIPQHQQQPMWMILVIGVHGVGKHYVIQDLIQRKRLRLLSFVGIDSGALYR
jgi:hypothetical protein